MGVSIRRRARGCSAGAGDPPGRCIRPPGAATRRTASANRAWMDREWPVRHDAAPDTHDPNRADAGELDVRRASQVLTDAALTLRATGRSRTRGRAFER